MGLVAILQSVWASLASLFLFRRQQSSPLPTAIPLKPRNNGPPQTPRRQPPHEYCSLGPNQLGSWRIQKEQFMRNPNLTASPKQRQRRNTSTTRRPQNLLVPPPVFRLPSLTAVDDWNARVDGGTYQISSFHPRQPLPAVIITPCTPEKKSSAFTASPTTSSSVPTTPPTPQLSKITQPVFVTPGPEDDDEDIALKRVVEDLQCALVQRDKEDINPFDVSSANSNSNSPSFNISQSLQISLSQDSASDDASWDIPWESNSGKVVKYMTSTPPLSWSLVSVTQQEPDPFKNVVKSPPRRSSAPYTDLFDLDMYLEASLASNTIDLGACSLESDNPFEDTFAVELEPIITVSLEYAAVPMNRLVKRERERERDVYRPSGYTRSPRFRFSVDENGSPVPFLGSPAKDKRRVGKRMTVVDKVRAFLDSDNEDDDESGDEEEEGGDDDTSDISMPALNARLREACRKSAGAAAYRESADPELEVMKGHRLFCVNADPPWPTLGVTSSAASLLTGHGSFRATSQRKSVPLLTESPRAGLVVASTRASWAAASPHASLQHANLSALRPSSRLLRDITNTMTTTSSSSSSSTSTLASIAQNPVEVVLMQNPVETCNPIALNPTQKNAIKQNPTTRKKTILTTWKDPVRSTKTRNHKVVRFGRDIANIVVDDDDSASLCGGNTTAGGEDMTMASVYSGENTMGSVYSGENTTASVYSGENTVGSVYSAQNTTTYSNEAAARALKARLRQACDNLSKAVWVEECDTVQSWEPVPF